jgi:hypothetical protein
MDISLNSCFKVLICLIATSFVLSSASAGEITISDKSQKSSFPLVFKKKAATIYFDKKEQKVVEIAVNAFKDDVHRITKITPLINHQNKDYSKYSIIVGTVGQSQLIDDLVANKKIDPASVKEKWETFQISILDKPFKGVDKALVIMGSDRRGTAYGLFELSRLIGVSPFYWWADVKPQQKNEIHVTVAKENIQSPDVKYRGIFLNDEDWGLQPWAAKNIDTEVKDLGPKTYTHIFELLLRLKANYIWPAMHPSTKAFYFYKENPKIADDYAIVVGSSHCEPMLRNNVFEWAVNYENEYGKKPGEWRYDLNKQQIDQYWFDRVDESKNYESVYTIGMRGIHDGSMPGPKDRNEKIKLLNEVMRIQRRMLEDNSIKPINSIPQIFCPYKEVLTLYRAGLELADDVTIVWADDNHGYIRQLSNPQEQNRSGGSGIYYHVSYWGAPQDYLWLSSISPSLISYEMYKAYQYEAKNLWVVNVGDIKPAELETQFFLDFAWDVEKWKPENAHNYVYEWAKEAFGAVFADDIAKIKAQYYLLAHAGKPEHIPYINFSDTEKLNRLKDYENLYKEVEKLKLNIPVDLQDAYFQLIYYPVVGAKLMNEKHFYAQTSLLLAQQGKDEALDFSKKAEQAFEQIKQETHRYNKEIANGKWDEMMDWKPRNREVFNLPEIATQKMIDEGKKNPIAYKPSRDPQIVLVEDFKSKKDAFNAQLNLVEGLGLNGKGYTLFPLKIDEIKENELDKAAYLEYEVTSSIGDKLIKVKGLPTQGVNEGRNVRYAISVDNQTPKIIRLNPPSENNVWRENVMRGYAVGESQHQFKKEKTNIKIYLLDPGTVINQIEIY